jgi:4-hydroxy 2-oxovalerate aldolase
MRIDSESTLKISDFGCVISSPLAVIYAISVAAAAGASRILLTGIDGFPASDYRQQEMVRIIQNFKSINPDVKLVAITPTTYPLSQQSVYNPSL